MIFDDNNRGQGTNDTLRMKIKNENIDAERQKGSIMFLFPAHLHDAIKIDA
jgi:hypothetical protein